MKKIAYKVSGIFIPVTDMQRSIEWYKRVFDLETIDESEMYTGLAFPGEATLVNLWKVQQPQPTTFDAGGDPTPFYNFESFDIQNSHAALQAKGVEVSPIHDGGDVRYFDCIDPDGNIVSIVEEMPSSNYYEHKMKYRKS